MRTEGEPRAESRLDALRDVEHVGVLKLHSCAKATGGVATPMASTVQAAIESRREVFIGGFPQVRMGICFPLSQVSPLALEASSQWDEAHGRFERSVRGG